MNNKKIIITMVVTISVLIICAATMAILKLSGIDLLKIAKSNNNNTLEERKVAEIDLDDTEGTVEDKIIDKKIEEIQNIDFSSTSTNQTLVNFISTSRANALNRELYVDMEERNVQEDYEEVKTYKPLSEVQISFNMDVSKPTGISKEDFISLVQRMRYDRTGILKANAGVIWECCQKYNVNEIFVLGICGIESAWCSAPQHQRAHNYASLMSGGKLIPYATDADGFEAMIKLLGQRYLTPGAGCYHGATITGVGTCYCNTTTWPPKVYKCMQQVFQ